MFLLYIDSGSGSLFFQALLSGLLTVIVFFKKIVTYIKYKLSSSREAKSNKGIDIHTENKLGNDKS